jgi:hypothetical protein
MKKISLFVIVNIITATLFSQNVKLPEDLQIGKHTVAEWNFIIDTTWGDGRTTAQKLSAFDLFWTTAREKSTNFFNNPINWDSVRHVYRPRVEAGISRGGFAGLMQRLSFDLGDSYSNFSDKPIYNTHPRNGFPTAVLRRSPGVNYESQAHFGAVLVPLQDSTLVVLRVASNHPLGLEPGDRIIGYDGVPWKNLYPLLRQMNFPVSAYRMVNGLGIIDHGSIQEVNSYYWLKSAGLNWHLFNTIDIMKYEQTDTIHLPTSLLEGFDGSVNGNEQIAVEGIEIPCLDFDGYQNLQYIPPVKWGIISGSNVGYIYVWHWYNRAKEDFKNAIDSLWQRDVDGLIVDYRCQITGTFGQELQPAYRRLFNSYAGKYQIYRRDYTKPEDRFALYKTSFKYDLWRCRFI